MGVAKTESTSFHNIAKDALAREAAEYTVRMLDRKYDVALCSPFIQDLTEFYRAWLRNNTPKMGVTEGEEENTPHTGQRRSRVGSSTC